MKYYELIVGLNLLYATWPSDRLESGCQKGKI